MRTMATIAMAGLAPFSCAHRNVVQGPTYQLIIASHGVVQNSTRLDYEPGVGHMMALDIDEDSDGEHGMPLLLFESTRRRVAPDGRRFSVELLRLAVPSGERLHQAIDVPPMTQDGACLVATVPLSATTTLDLRQCE